MEFEFNNLPQECQHLINNWACNIRRYDKAGDTNRSRIYYLHLKGYLTALKDLGFISNFNEMLDWLLFIGKYRNDKRD